ncbi:MAG: T9SS type A sorting domain-containing protein [candidate division WOR-3 bacterium]|jgi:hypothetical protein
MKPINIAVLILITGLLMNRGNAHASSRDSAYLNIKLNNDTTGEVQNEEQIVMNPRDSTNLVAVWRDFRVGYRQVAYAYSFDGGLTWGQDLFIEPQYTWDSDPGLTVDTAGNFYAVILSFFSTQQPNGLFVYKSTDGGVSWSGPVTVINNVPDVFEDKELIACDRSGGPHTDNLYVAWTRFGAMRDILLCRSTDGGNSFVGPVTVSDGNNVQWPVPCVGPNSEVYVAWVEYPPDRICLDRSYDGGQTFGSDITIQNVNDMSRIINGSIWVFSFPAMDIDITNGPYQGNMYVAYMDDSPGFTDTDLFFTRSTDGGNTWSQKVRINDDQLNNGCDQFHPWLMVAPDGSIIVVFLDRRNDPGNLLMDCYMTTSIDAGNTWSPNERISTVSCDPTAGSTFMELIDDPMSTEQPEILAGRAGLIGEYIGVTASSISDIHPLWTDTRLGDQDVFVGVKDTAGTGIDGHENALLGSAAFSVFPNPVRDKMTIRIHFSPNTRPRSIMHLAIHDCSGRVVKTRDLAPSEASSTLFWDLSDEPKPSLGTGVYFCTLRTGNAVISRKFVIP